MASRVKELWTHKTISDQVLPVVYGRYESAVVRPPAVGEEDVVGGKLLVQVQPAIEQGTNLTKYMKK